MRFIRLSSIWSALSSLIPGLSPLWNLKARVTARAAIMTMTAMSIVLNESCGNLWRLDDNSAATEGLLA